jgi:hypothetical protein
MSTNKTTTNPHHIQSKKNLKARSDTKHIHQFFTVHFIAIFLIIVVGLSSILLFVTLQHNHSQTKITAQFDALQTQFLQQKYLMNADIVIDSMLKSVNSHELLVSQQALSLQSKKLSLLKSNYKDSYQGSFSRNNLAMDLITRIESNDVQNELLKAKSLIQLDTLLDAIEIRLNDQQTSLKQAGLLYDVENQLTNIVVMLKDLNLKTSLVTFEKLNKKMDEVFVTDYARQLANQQDESQGMADIVRDFIRFEDLILKEDLLAKWQDNLYLIGDYQQQLIEEQQQLQSILTELLVSQDGADSALVKSDSGEIDIDFLLFKQIPKWVGISSTTLVICVVGLLWLVRRKMKAISQFNVDSISRVIADEPSTLIVDEKDSVSQLHNQPFYNAESECLIRKIQLINSSKAEYLALIDKNQKLEEKIARLMISVKSTAQLRLEQQYFESLHLAALKQLVRLSTSVIQEPSNQGNVSEATNYLYQAHLQGRYLVSKLKRTSNYRYIRNSDVLLTLSDENFIAQLQAIMLSLRSELLLCKNTISVIIDEKIIPEVNLDVELFCEMFAAFVSLVLSHQKGRNLALKLQLVDKNKGQQIIRFTGQVEGGENPTQLPHALLAFSDDSLDHSELGDYFNTLIQLQHGDDVSATLTGKSYSFSFTLPLAVSNNQQEQHFPVLLLPGRGVDIEKDCAILAAKYLVMPIEVLIAVKSPEMYQRLQQLLQGMGLQVTFVSSKLILQQYWQSGRFAILLTEIDCQPFTEFKVEEKGTPFTSMLLTRGVFSLSDQLEFIARSEKYTHWVFGDLKAKSTTSELVTALLPWIKEKDCDNLITEEKALQVTSNNDGIDALPEEEFALTSSIKEYSFNFERYLKHQGSAELAIFMLDEYTSENILLVKELSQAVAVHDGKKADDIIQALLVNARILAAENLLHLCQQWHTLLTTQGLDSCEKLQMVLLSKTKQAVDEISQHAAAIA